MPSLAVRPCQHPGCPEYAEKNGRCVDHAPEVDARRGKTAERGLGAAWRRVRAMKLRRDPICQIRTHCNGALATTVDHIIPRSKRPDLCLVWSNLQSACKDCNEAKGDC